MFIQAFAAVVELSEVRQPVGGAVGNVIERLLHAGRETQIHEIREMTLQQLGHSHCGKSRNQLTSVLANVTPVLNRAQDTGISTRTTDPFGFERPHQRRFGEPCGRFGFVSDGVDILTLERILFGHRRQRRILIFDRSFGIVRTFDIRPEEAGEFDSAARGAKFGIGNGDRDGVEPQQCVGHLGGHRALPNHLIQFVFRTGEPDLVGGFHFCTGRPNRFVSLLSAFGFR